MPPSLRDDLLFGAAAAAAHTGLTRRIIYHLVEAGALPVIRKGRRLYFRRSELDQAFRALDPTGSLDCAAPKEGEVGARRPGFARMSQELEQKSKQIED